MGNPQVQSVRIFRVLRTMVLNLKVDSGGHCLCLRLIASVEHLMCKDESLEYGLEVAADRATRSGAVLDA